MELVKQTSNFDCGHACVAMITGKKLEQVNGELTFRPTGLSDYDIEKELLDIGFEVKRTMKLRVNEMVIPAFGVINIKITSNGHWAVVKGEQVFCPHYGRMDLKDYLRVVGGKEKITSAVHIMQVPKGR